MSDHPVMEGCPSKEHVSCIKYLDRASRKGRPLPSPNRLCRSCARVFLAPRNRNWAVENAELHSANPFPHLILDKAVSSFAKMTQVCLLDSDRLSTLLGEALSWSNQVSSLMVSATNGSILAYAYRDTPPSIKAMRTQSTTMTAAYTVASEDVLVFEAQNTGTISVVTAVADHVLLAVTGRVPVPEPEPKHKPEQPTPLQHGPNGHAEEVENTVNGVDDSPDEEEDPETDGANQQIRTDLEVVSQELASILRGQLAAMKWPDDI